MHIKYSEQGLAWRMLRRSDPAFPPRALNLISFHSLLVYHQAPVLNLELRKGVLPVGFSPVPPSDI